ncbi:MAG: hypothetical protein GY877_07490 [Hyphomicrobium sp.]|nr:hypothetical protein [Hyphomicrobium sp.]
MRYARIDSQQLPSLHRINGEQPDVSEVVTEASEDELRITEALMFCETLCEEFHRRWNVNERFYRYRQRRADRLFIVEELAVASDGETTVTRRYPEHLRPTLEAIAELTRRSEPLHNLSPDGAVVIGNYSDLKCVLKCVPVKEAIKSFLNGPKAQRKSADSSS